MDIEKRQYTFRDYTPDQISEAISTFMATGGSMNETRKLLKAGWGYAPSEPTIRKWCQSSNEALNLLDHQTAAKLQHDVAYIIQLSYDQLVEALEEKTFPPARLGQLYSMMTDKFLVLMKVRNELNRSFSDYHQEIVGEEVERGQDELVQELLKEGNELNLD